MTPETLVYILSGIIALQLVEIIYLYYMNHKKNSAVTAQMVDNSKAMQKIIQDANKKAEEIVQNAVSTSEQILNRTQSVKDSFDKQLAVMYTKSVDKHNKDFEEVLTSMTDQYNAVFADAKKALETQTKKTIFTIEELAKKEVTDFANQNNAKTDAAENYLKSKIDAEFALAKQEIEAYKNQEIIRLKEEIQKKITVITTTVLKGSISRDKQEKLILEALEKAQKDNLFTA